MNRSVEITTGRRRASQVKRRSPQVSEGHHRSEEGFTGQEEVTTSQTRSLQVRVGREMGSGDH